MPDKICNGCNFPKLLKEFPKDRRNKSGRGTKCNKCVNEIKENYYKKYPECEIRDRLKQAKASKKWYESNREYLIVSMRENHLKRKYGIYESDYKIMLNKQGGLCAICRSNNPGRNNKNFLVDHSHITNKIRGLLCHNCNAGLGILGEENLERAIEYVGFSKSSEAL